jgi:hypothetical protein
MKTRLYALVGDIWYQIMNIEGRENNTYYKLYSLNYLVPNERIKEIMEESSI